MQTASDTPQGTTTPECQPRRHHLARPFLQAIGFLSLITAFAPLTGLQVRGAERTKTGTALSEPSSRDWLVDNRPFVAKVDQDAAHQSLVLENGLIRRTIQLSPNAATVALDNRMTGASLLRAVEPEALVTLDGKEYAVGGLSGQPDRAYLLPEWVKGLTNQPGSFQFESVELGKPAASFAWKRTRHASDLSWPPRGSAVALRFHGSTDATRDLKITVHYELYDGIPVVAKWFTLKNGSARSVVLDRFTSERLSFVEAESAVDERADLAWRTPNVQVFSDYMFKGMDAITGNQVASWQPDPAFRSQVSYALKTPCVLVCQPPIGPGITIQPGTEFTSFKTFLIVHDSTERERQGLTLRRAHRTLAPWSTENPIMMHVRHAETKAFRTAVDQCAEVGFEMIIYTFGSGLNMESDKPEYLQQIKADVDYAHSKGIQVGAYSLFSSRRIDDANDVINPKTGRPGGAIFGNAPCFGSQWGLDYMRRLTNFMSQTGLDLLEHDGPYPGDVCASTKHPGHKGEADSQWVNWSMSTQLYQWCRERGIYINQPDYYFFSGGNKTAMGYREDNWSLPRAQQLIHARQNIFDGSWTKPQTAGWMFVPLTEYQGGGAAATIEPMKDHLDAYEGHLANNLGAGVQACWRGPRLYDTDETRNLVKRYVDWFKKHRDILESDVIHCRRADGRDVDYLVHVNPSLKTRAFSMVHNPLTIPVERTLPFPLYYAGLQGSAKLRIEEGKAQKVTLDAQGRAWVTLKIGAQSRTWLTFE
jgi:hypothetical protein